MNLLWWVQLRKVLNLMSKGLNVASAPIPLVLNKTSGVTSIVNATPDVEDSRISILCDQCARPFKTKHGLQLHVKSKHLNIFRFKCSVCPAQFNMLSAFWGHLASHHKELKEKCSECGAEFQYIQSLKDHKKSFLCSNLQRAITDFFLIFTR